MEASTTTNTDICAFFLSSFSGVAEVSVVLTYDAVSLDMQFPPIRDFYILFKGRELIIQSQMGNRFPASYRRTRLHYPCMYLL